MAAKFNAKEFCNNPSLDKLRDQIISKDDWKYIAITFDIPFESSHTKDQIKNIVVEELCRREILELEAVDELTPMTSSGSQERSLEYEKEPYVSPIASKVLNPDVWTPERLAFEKLKLEYELEQKARDRELVQEKVKLEQEKFRQELFQKEKERELEQEKLRQERELEQEKLRLEEEKVKLEREKLQIELATLDQKKKQENSTQRKALNLSKNIPLLPTFNEEDPDSFFTTFEKTADHLEWEKTEWTWLLQPKLTGRASIVFSNLESFEYDFVKKAILDAYSVTPESYRKKFRSYTKPEKYTFLEFAKEKLRLFNKWLQTSEVSTFKDLVNCVVLEEFKRKLPFSTLVFLEEKGETDLTKAAQLADSYALIHKNISKQDKSRTSYVKSSSTSSPVTGDGSQFKKKANSSEEFCSYCKQTGHTISTCPHPKCRTSKNPAPPKPVACVNTESSNDLFSAFKTPGTVSISKNSPKYPITILRDTASAQSVLCRNALPSVANTYTGEVVELDYLDDHSSKTPIAKVYLDSELLKGEVQVAVATSIPHPGTTFLLANDLAGSGMIPNLSLTEKPLEKSPTELLDKTDPHIFPVCAVTRSQAASKPLATSHSSNPPDTLISQHISKENLIKAQEVDPTLAKIRHVADKPSTGKNPCFYYHEGVLMRSFHPPDKADTDIWSNVHQVVIPSSIRRSVIELSHDGLAGHLGQQNTYKKILAHFYWPGIKKDVANYVKTCVTCQITGKPNEVIPQAPLQPIPVTAEPFERIVIDCVGPLPKTKKGNQYLLTVMDTSTRYPEAFAMKDIQATKVVKNLLHLFTKVGIPKEIQTDQGSNFTSKIMTAVMKELNVHHKLATAYHPQSQGCLERFHQTFKSLIKKYCHETEKEWDENIDFLLFAIRECPQESLSYSPFELLYGRQIRGPLKVLKDKWFETPSDHPLRTVSEYVDTLKNKLHAVRTLALNNLKTSQAKMKTKFDTNSKSRIFFPGDKVLLFLPIPGHALKSKYTGPYVVTQKLTPLNYVIETPDRRKHQQLVHVNQIKKFHEREVENDSQGKPCLVINVEKSESGLDVNEEIDIPLTRNPNNSHILQHLDDYLPNSETQKTDLKRVLLKHPSVTSDVPGSCNVHLHDVVLVSDDVKPIKQHPYRLNPQKQIIMKEEINFMLENNLIEESCSPWASPVLLVPKPDGSSRLCTDYRKLNKVTVTDAFPLPRIDDLVDKVGSAKFVSVIDLQKGYYQIGMTDRAKKLSAFITPFGLYQYKVMPFGMKNAPATFQRIMSHTILGLEGVSCYLDDIVVISDTWSEHVVRLEKLLSRLSQVGLTINLAKSCFGQGTVNYLGHVVGQGTTRPKTANIENVLQFPQPIDRKSLMRFLGMCGFYRRFCHNFATVAAPLTDLTSTKVKFLWTSACTSAFNSLKSLLSTFPVLRAPDPERPYQLQVDASGVGVGAVLLQSYSDVLHPVSYFSCKLKKHQRGYSTVEKEALGLILAIKKFECYLPQNSPIIVHTDHNPLTFIDRMKNTNQRILRWALQLQEYSLNVRHIRGVDNRIADTLSRDLPASQSVSVSLPSTPVSRSSGGRCDVPHQ